MTDETVQDLDLQDAKDRRERDRVRERRRALREVLGSPHGRAVLSWIVFEVGGYHESPMSMDATLTSYKTGRRDVAAQVIDESGSIDKGALVTMFAEWTERHYGRG